MIQKVKKTGVFPGSFDPFTIGHQDIVDRALVLFDEVIIAIGLNATKKYMFPLEQRSEWIKNLYKDNDRVIVEHYEGLTVRFCESRNAGFILRGLRNSTDFEYEKSIGTMNRSLSNGIETVSIFCDPEHAAINSSIVRDIIRNGGDASAYLPDGMAIK